MMACSRCSPVSAPAGASCRSSEQAAMPASSALPQLMAVLCAQRQPIEAAELLDILERLRRKRRLALEGMQHDALQQIAQAHVLLLRDGLQHLQHSLF